MSTRRPQNDMDDRRSAVSSFYGGGPSPMNTLNNPAAQDYSRADGRERRDSSSTFFGRNVDEYGNSLLGPPRGDAGYSSDSYRAQPGRVEPVKGLHDDEEQGGAGGWNVFADFNNAGPRYSTAFGGDSNANSGGYRPLETPRTPMSKADDDPVELVTVPAFGPEWKADELRDMTKAGKAQRKADERQRRWKEWSRDQRGVFGVGWATRKVLVWTLFVMIIIIALVLVFVIPRPPGFAFNGDAPLTENGGDLNFARAPAANFTFNAKVDLQVDTHANFVPLHFSSITADVYDIQSFEKIATGHLEGTTVPAKQYVPIQIPLVFSYSAPNSSDATWARVYDACKNKGQFPDGKRPGLKLRLVLAMKIRGAIGTTGAATEIDDAPCPIELPTNSV